MRPTMPALPNALLAVVLQDEKSTIRPGGGPGRSGLPPLVY